MSRRLQRQGAPQVGTELLEHVRSNLVGSGKRPVPSALAEALERARTPLGATGVLESVDAVGAALTGAGVLQPLLDDEAVTDVLVNGPGQIWVDRGDGLRRAEVLLDDEQELRALAVRLAAASGRRLDDANPCVDARLPDGVRLHAVLPPISPAGTLLSLRVPRRRTLTLDDLLTLGTVPGSWGPVLEAVVRKRLSFLISGGTGSGKTTVLSSLLSLADPGERVVLVEDAAELRPQLPHVVRLEARHGNVEGAGEVTQQELVRQALRMRPDRIVVGECRGAEVRDLLAALNTGHEGGCGTVHANAAGDVPARLEALGALAGMNRDAVTSQAASALDVVLHLERSSAVRHMAEIGVVRRRDGGLVVEAALTRRAADGDSRDRAWPELAARLGLEDHFARPG